MILINTPLKSDSIVFDRIFIALAIMIDSYTLSLCKSDREIRCRKIRNLEHAIEQSEAMIAESMMNDEALVFLRKKVAESRQDLESLYLLEDKNTFDL